jgi:hypothetical protein
MRYWAEFYHMRNGSYIPAVGDRSVVILDGRMSDENKKSIAADECRKRGYDGWRLARGRRLSEPFYLTAVPQNVYDCYYRR